VRFVFAHFVAERIEQHNELLILCFGMRYVDPIRQRRPGINQLA
jgi:hypothetical protein